MSDMEQWAPCPLCGEGTDRYPREFDDGTVVGECFNESCCVIQFDATRNVDTEMNHGDQ